MNLNELHSVFFLGIGGIGMSALARYFLQHGKKVAGYDRTSSHVTHQLEKEGIQIRFELDDLDVFEGFELVVYTPAIRPEQQEYKLALASGLPVHKRSEVLGWISGNYETLAIAGTHGKTTTSAMLTHLLLSSNIKTTAFLGGISANLQSNYVYGESPYLVVEADEYDRSFLSLNPKHALVTSMDPDHLDIYGSVEQLQKGFQDFVDKVDRSGSLTIHHSYTDKVNTEILTSSYGIDDGDYKATKLRKDDLAYVFDIEGPDLNETGIYLYMQGRHNVENMLAAWIMASKCGADTEALKSATASFKGVFRRFEWLLHTDTLSYIDDYAHHPQELEAVILTARELFPHRRLIVAFQPHLYTRTRDLAVEFCNVLSKADLVILLPLYPAREHEIPGINSAMLAKEIDTETKLLNDKRQLSDLLIDNIQGNEVILTLGAGDIDGEREAVRNTLLKYLSLDKADTNLLNDITL